MMNKRYPQMYRKRERIVVLKSERLITSDMIIHIAAVALVVWMLFSSRSTKAAPVAPPAPPTFYNYGSDPVYTSPNVTINIDTIVSGGPPDRHDFTLYSLDPDNPLGGSISDSRTSLTSPAFSINQLNLGTLPDGRYSLDLTVSNASGSATNSVYLYVHTRKSTSPTRLLIPVHEVVLRGSLGLEVQLMQNTNSDKNIDFMRPAELSQLVTASVVVPSGTYDNVVLKTCASGQSSFKVQVEAQAQLGESGGINDITYYTRNISGLTTNPLQKGLTEITINSCEIIFPIEPMNITTGIVKDLKISFSTKNTVHFDLVSGSISLTLPIGVSTDIGTSVSLESYWIADPNLNSVWSSPYVLQIFLQNSQPLLGQFTKDIQLGTYFSVPFPEDSILQVGMTLLTGNDLLGNTLSIEKPSGNSGSLLFSSSLAGAPTLVPYLKR